jgi:tetratricopeptide (TPR) repeat protein
MSPGPEAASREPAPSAGGSGVRAPSSWAGIPGYEILGELGRGGMGVVYKARQRALNRVVALKMILAGDFAGAADRARFQAEAEVVARLAHPNIVQIYEVGEADGQPFFSLEFCPGGSLDHKLAGNPLPSREAAQLVETLAGAVHAAHRQHVIHRDLKPANVLLTADRIPKITDFGLAKLGAGAPHAGAGRTATGAVLGTPSYMAPEQAGGRGKDAGPAADVYALGAILYELLTGRPPFKGPTPLDTLMQVMAEDPVPPRRLQALVPRDLETICLKCLEKDPGKRYLIAGELADDLGRFLRREPIRARPAGGLYRLGKFAQRHKALVAAVGAVLLALVGGTVGTSIGLVRAQAERDRAREAERETQALLAASHRDAARLAMRRGAWREALRSIDRALAANSPDAPALRLEKVKAWCALHEIAPAVRELEDLSRQADLGDLDGPVLLWKADLALNHSLDNLDANLEQVRQAVSRGLPPAERAYAQGLLAGKSREATDCFRRAVEEDPFNPRANGMLALCLTSLGQHQEARDRLLVAERLFPEDPSFRVIHAMLLAMQDDLGAARAQLEQARSQLRARQMAAAQALVGLCNEVPGVGRMLEGMLFNDPKTSRWEMTLYITRVLSRAGAARAALRDPEGDLYLPLPPVLPKAFAQLPDLASLAGMQWDRDGAIKKLGQVVLAHPEGLLYLTLGMLLGLKDKPESWAEAEKAFLRSVESPSLIPVRRLALFGATASEWVLSREGPPAAREEMSRRAGENARKVVALGVSPAYADLLTKVALNMGDVGLAHWVVSEWERQAPKDPRLEPHRIELAFRLGANGRAIKLADPFLKRNPREPGRWQQIRAEAERRLRGEAQALGPPR